MRSVLSIFVLGLTLFFMTALPATSTASVENKKAEKPLVKVYVETLKPVQFYEELSYISNLRPFREVQVFSYIEGTIEKKHKLNGQFVRKGEKLISVKNINPGYNYSEHIVTAPISGLITGLTQELGAYIQKRPAIFSIADVSQWRVSVPMLQEDLQLLDKEHHVLMQPHGFASPIKGKLLRVSPNINQVLGTTVVDFVFSSAELKKIRIGMVGELKLRYNLKETIGINNNFVLESQSQKQKYVYVLNKDNTVERRWLETGVERDGKTEITSGLKTGDTIVTQSPTWWFEKGQKVEPVKKL